MAELVKAELGRLILTKLKDPRLGFITVTNVSMSADLRHANVSYSVMNEPQTAEDTAQALESAKGFLQHELAGSLTLRLTPRLTFHRDESVEHSIQIEKIIKKLHAEDAEDKS
ncbi:MAG: 30S ribosome-binding factor RbfA [Candidatus Omnitrophica bacterium]|nr:30S ribosome-binding factor RbfA [Candidatus Omnitrophota bacterium]